MKTKLLAALVLMAGAANADTAENMGYASVGTAFKFVQSADVSVTINTSTGVVMNTSSTDRAGMWRFMCDVAAHKLTSQAVTPSVTKANMPLAANTPEYFIVGKSQNTAFIANSEAGYCWGSKAGR